MKRWGTTEALGAAKPRSEIKSGYVYVQAPDHPLCRASMSGRVLEHRKVYYDAYGEGPFNCHRCGVEVNWSTLHIDHLNDIRNDNRIENLAAACEPCNLSRGLAALPHPRGNRRMVEYQGRVLCVTDWAKELGIKANTLSHRLSAGWSIERAFTELVDRELAKAA
jgi:hypothetical protein